MENLDFISEFNEDLFDPTFSNDLYFDDSDNFGTFLEEEGEIEDSEIYAAEMDFKDFVNLMH